MVDPTTDAGGRDLDSDVLIVGGGSAGTAAAVAAGRAEASTLLIEAGNCLGGTSTAGGVSSWFASVDGLGDVFNDFRALLDRFGARREREFNAEIAKIAWQHLAEDAGVRVLFHSTPCAVQIVDGRFERADVVCRASKYSVAAKYAIDATGEGDLSALAGAEFNQGDPENGHTLHMSLTATLFDTTSPVTPYLPPGLDPIESDDGLPGLKANTVLPDGRVYLNMTKIIDHDPTDPFSLSDAELEARRQLARVIHYLQRTKYPRHMPASTGSRIGIREGRRIVGDYVITEDDVLGDGTVFDDGVTVATSQIDFHSLTRPGGAGWRKRIKPYNIPFRSLVARGFKNLLVAGKCISGDQVAQSSYRMTPTCVGMGQAAGTAAAMAASSGCRDIRALPTADLRRALIDAGVELDPAKHAAFPSHGRNETPDRDGAR